VRVLRERQVEGSARRDDAESATMEQSHPAPLRVTSTTFADGEAMPQSTRFHGFGVGGGNRSPHLAWSGAPATTKSFAVILHDPDAPTGTGFFHWVAFNIPADVHELAENAGEASGGGMPPGAVQSPTDFGARHYGGPAPPPGHGPHRYNFHVYALDVPKIDGDETTTAALLRFMMLGHVVAEGKLTGIFER
jgi:Raf kinase inhibitor-like YbhB/YbcL family protein